VSSDFLLRLATCVGGWIEMACRPKSALKKRCAVQAPYEDYFFLSAFGGF
jgi:hypothetical protein